jgi:hypothetical protein
MLCDKCQSIDFTSMPIQTEPPPEYYARQNLSLSEEDQPSDKTGRFFTYHHYSSIKELKTSATKTGCHLCAQFLRALERVGLALDSPHKYHDGPIELRWYPHQEKVRQQDGLREWEMFVVARTVLRDIKSAFAFVRYGDESTTSAWIGDYAPSLHSVLRDKAFNEKWSTGCDGNFLLAGIWLRRCLALHPLCAISTHPNPPLPTRVLDVGAGSSSSLGIRLVDGVGRHGPYVTLSHVWGRSRIITSTTSTIEQRRIGIPLSDLSRTFRDAVKVIRQLSVRYLWIDSLCKNVPVHYVVAEIMC